MWRGCFSSFKYTVICLSESWRPNQVFHQKRNGMRTINQAVTKNKRRFRGDMRWGGRAGCSEESSRAISGGSPSLGEDGGLAMSFLGVYSAFLARVLRVAQK